MRSGHRLWKFLPFEEQMKGKGLALGLLPQTRVELHLASLFGKEVENRSPWNFQFQHFLQADGLGTKLDVVIQPIMLFSSLVFDRVRHAVFSMPFHQIRHALKFQVVADNAKSCLLLLVATCFSFSRIYPAMEQTAVQSMGAFLPNSLQAMQGASPGAKG